MEIQKSLGLLLSMYPVFKIEASYEFHFEGLSNFNLFSWRARSNPRRQSKNIEMKYKTHTKIVHVLYGTCFQCNVKN